MAGRRSDSDSKYDPSSAFGQGHRQASRPSGSSFDNGPMVDGLKETHEAIKQTIESARKTGHDILGGVGSALGSTKETLDSLHNGALELQKDARETVQTLEEAGNTIGRGFKTASSVASTLKGVGEWMTSAPKVLDDFQQASKGLGEAAPLVAENTPPVLKPERPAP